MTPARPGALPEIVRDVHSVTYVFSVDRRQPATATLIVRCSDDGTISVAVTGIADPRDERGWMYGAGAIPSR